MVYSEIIKGFNFGRNVDLSKIRNDRFYKVVSIDFISFIKPTKKGEEFIFDLAKNHEIRRDFNLMIYVDLDEIFNISFYINRNGFLDISKNEILNITNISSFDLYLLKQLANYKEHKFWETSILEFLKKYKYGILKH